VSRIKLLWMSDSPVFCTGFGTVTREVLRRLAARDHYEVACVAWGYEGWPYERHDIPYDLYPSVSPNLGRDTLPKALDHFKPDILVTLGDIWMVEWISELADRNGCRFFPYFPIDGAPLYPPWRAFVQSADVPITCSRFAQRLVECAIPGIRVEMIYHGVDTEIFRPLERARPAPLEGKFIVGCTARNQPRKNLPSLIKAFARFSHDKDDAVLYLHSDPNDIGWDLLDLLQRYQVVNRTCISKSASTTRGVSSRKLNEIYNLFDVMVLPTAGEGFGLPILESMAAGVPVIATGYSSCVELLEGRGELIKVKDFMTAGRHNVEYAIPDIDDLVCKLNLLYRQPDLRQRNRARGLELARSLDWTFIVEQWDGLLRVRPR
jgi:glycosyltransferase involved in cell wall biosynthesis